MSPTVGRGSGARRWGRGLGRGYWLWGGAPGQGLRAVGEALVTGTQLVGVDEPCPPPLQGTPEPSGCGMQARCGGPGGPAGADAAKGPNYRPRSQGELF